jgi:hypothetical protein
MNQMERFLSNLPRLTNFTLQTKDSIDLADGHRWERLSAGFIIFNFKLKIIVDDISRTLASFRTPFWLQKKCWYVAYKDGYLFSVPKFAPKHVSTFYNPQYFTAPDETFLYNNITKLIILSPIEVHTHRFAHVEMLEIPHYYIHVNYVPKASFLLSQQEERNLNALSSIPLLLYYLRKMPHCHTLTINIDLTLEFVDQLSGNRFEQIRTLEICSSTKMPRYVVEEILHPFPRVERLRISSISSYTDMIRLIDGFKYLSNACFTIEANFTERERDWFQNPELSIRGVQRLKTNSFICRFDRSSIDSSSYFVHIWINEEVSSFM